MVYLSYHDMKRLELYSRNMADHHMILDTLRLPYLQVAILLATGLQHRDVDSIAHARAGADRVAHRQGPPTAVQRGGHPVHD